MRPVHFILIVAAAGLLTSCASITKEQKALLASSIDCSHWESDIAALKAEKASVAKQLVLGVSSVMPTAAAIGILSGDYKNRTRVASGKYNRDINAKIAEIRRQCE